MKEIKKLPDYFLLVLLLATLYFGYLIFQPYFAVIIMAVIFALLFFPIYKWIRKIFKKREGLAALSTVIIFVLVILIPLANFVALLVKESIETYPVIESKLSNGFISSAFEMRAGEVKYFFEHYIPFFDVESLDLKKVVLDLGKNLTSFIIKNANVLVSGTTNFFVSLFFMLITMYYFLKDGERFVDRLMYITPLSNKYDRELFEKFREVSKSTILGSLVTSIIQGILGSIAFLVVGLPAFFLGVATGIASFIPVVGTAIVWVPVAIVLGLTGHLASMLFIIIWGVFVIGLSDNLIRTKLIQSKSNIHPLLVFFSIFGGLKLWGFLGIIFGPLILALLLTVVHIYELEYSEILEKKR